MSASDTTDAAPQHTNTGEPWNSLDENLRRLLSSLKANKGLSWEEVAVELGKRGWQITPSNLMTRQSRMSFRADELLLLLDVMGVDALQAIRSAS